MNEPGDPERSQRSEENTSDGQPEVESGKTSATDTEGKYLISI